MNTMNAEGNISKDHTIEADHQVFDEMPEVITNQIDEIAAVGTEIVSEKVMIEEDDVFNGVSEEGVNLHIEERLASDSIKEDEDGGGLDGRSEVRDTGNGEDVTGADQMFDEMSEQVTTLNDDDAATSTILAEDITVFDGMSEGVIVQNNETDVSTVLAETVSKEDIGVVQDVFDGMSEGEGSEDDEDEEYDEDCHIAGSEEEEGEEEEEGNSSSKRKRKPLSSFIQDETFETLVATPNATFKKSKKKKERGSAKSSSRKGKKKSKLNSNNGASVEDRVFITPVARFPDRSDDSEDMKICLSKMYKAEKVELSEDRLSAGSSKGYRMVRATRGVVEGAWYFEIKILKLGETGHTRLGWSMEKGDLQAPVGYDANSFGYRDIDGSKVHKATREKYGEAGYVEGDTIGFYINLPNGSQYAPKPPQFVWYKGQKYMCAADGKEEVPKVIPGSEICFFKNGVCQGVAFKDLYGGRYYPAASMYTLPNQPNCLVEFNFGPDFECFPQDFDSRPLPLPMIEVPYVGFDGGDENGVSDEKKC